MNEFDELLVLITKQLSLKEKKSNGIFFTCNSIINSTLQFINIYIKKNKLKIKKIY